MYIHITDTDQQTGRQADSGGSGPMIHVLGRGSGVGTQRHGHSESAGQLRRTPLGLVVVSSGGKAQALVVLVKHSNLPYNTTTTTAAHSRQAVRRKRVQRTLEERRPRSYFAAHRQQRNSRDRQADVGWLLLCTFVHVSGTCERGQSADARIWDRSPVHVWSEVPTHVRDLSISTVSSVNSTHSNSKSHGSCSTHGVTVRQSGR